MIPADYFLDRARRVSAASPSHTLVPLSAQGRHMVGPDGAIVKILSTSAFRAIQLFRRDRPKVERFLAQLAALRYNCLRAFCMHGAPANDPFLPPVDLGLVDEALAFFRECGFYTHLVAFTGQAEGDPEYMPAGARLSYLQDLLTRLAAKGHAPYVLGEVINEDYVQGLIAHTFPASMFRGHLWSRSAYVYDSPTPDLQWAGMEPERKGDPVEDERKAHDLIEIPFGGPRGVIEPEKMERLTPRSARVLAELTRLFGFMWTSHGAYPGVQNCELADRGPVFECMQAAADGFLNPIIPLEAAAWSYSRDEGAVGFEYQLGGPLGENGNDAGAQHVYAASTDRRSAAVVTAKGSTFTWKAKPGWRLVASSATAAYAEAA